MPLMDHIRELRNRVVKMVLALGAGMIVGFVFFNPVWHVIERPVVPRGDTRADRVQYARRQPAGLVGADGRVLPADQGRRHRRGDPLLAGLAVPDLGLHRARPVRPGEALGLHLHRHRRPAVPDRGRGSPTCRWAGPCTSCSA